MSFHFCKADHHLEVVDRASMTFRSEHRFLLEATVPSRFFHHGYFWTGSGAERETMPEVVSEIDDWGFPQHRIHGPLIVEGDARILVVDLGRTLSPGEQTTVHFRHRMKDLKNTFKPMLQVRPSSSVREEITLKVTLPNWSGLDVNFRQFTHDTEKVLVSRKVNPQESDASRLVFEVVIVNPNSGNLGHRLEWTHDEN
ncbi:hypothetical protein HFO69_31830 [Rhizobium laguerreae]|uniref:hypothetical protein n=1 Tax=Rhizobium laguerreae TaxID=1076926 RepID=UPI001C908587|nr:hypothetical protein [Rhizobium laguerreae]MBY3102240.1 hypothetical protein [Rhizobium laguerreae]